ncbi:MAG: DUF3311 domain-containing protein [Actinobacteria bacterium]|nr:DUF3311 domain-containing protein [Actinomycetota bacterium]
MQDMQSAKRPARAWWYLLLAIPFIAMLWVPSYVSVSPEIAGIPFFYWYQFVWVLITGVLTAVVYFATEERRPRAGDRAADSTGRATHD